MASGSVKITKLNKNTTMAINVEITRRFTVRLRVAVALIRLAGWVLGARTDVRLTEGRGMAP